MYDFIDTLLYIPFTTSRTKLRGVSHLL